MTLSPVQIVCNYSTIYKLSIFLLLEIYNLGTSQYLSGGVGPVQKAIGQILFL